MACEPTLSPVSRLTVLQASASDQTDRLGRRGRLSTEPTSMLALRTMMELSYLRPAKLDRRKMARS